MARFDGFEQRVFSDALFPAEQQRVIYLFAGTLYAVRQPFPNMISVVGKDFPGGLSHGFAFVSSPSLINAGRYRLKQVTPLRLIHPPSDTSLSRISIGSPGDHVICSTGRF